MTGLSGGSFALLLGLLICVSYPAVILGVRSFVFRDYGLFGYPLASYVRSAYAAGAFPLWDPWNDCGIPFLAQWNTMALYPPILIYLLLPFTWALGVFCLGHLFWGGLGMYFLARRWTAQGWSGAFAGIAYAFSGLLLNSLMWPNNIAAFGWAPWVVAATDRAWQGGGMALVGAAWAGAMQMLTGAPEVIAFTWSIAAFNWGWTAWRARRTGRTRMILTRWLARGGAVVVLVAALAAVQLAPFFQLLRHSQRGEQYATGDWAMPLTGWANLLVPLFHTHPTPAGVYFQADQYWTSSYYLGIGVLLLAGWSVVGARRPRVVGLTVLAVAGLWLALGERGLLLSGLRRVCPGLGFMRFPVKLVVLPVVTVPLLAGMGLTGWFQVPERDRSGNRAFWSLGGMLFGGIALILLTDRWFPASRENVQVTWVNGMERLLWLILTVVCLTWWRRVRGVALERWAGIAFLLVVWADLASQVPRQNPTVPPSVYAPGFWAMNARERPPALGTGRVMLSPGADLKTRYTYLSDPKDGFIGRRLLSAGDCNLLDRVPKVGGMFSLRLRDESDVESAMYDLHTNLRTAPADYLGIRRINAKEDIFRWEKRKTALPLVTAGQRPIFVPRSRSLQALFASDFDPRTMVILPAALRGQVNASGKGKAEVLKQRFETDSITFKVRASGPTLVSVAQAYYPNWEAQVDGKPVPLWEANHAFQALEVGTGEHTVHLVYRDRAFAAGGFLSLVAWGGTFLVAGEKWRRMRRGKG